MYTHLHTHQDQQNATVGEIDSIDNVLPKLSLFTEGLPTFPPIHLPKDADYCDGKNGQCMLLQHVGMDSAGPHSTRVNIHALWIHITDDTNQTIPLRYEVKGTDHYIYTYKVSLSIMTTFV